MKTAFFTLAAAFTLSWPQLCHPQNAGDPLVYKSYLPGEAEIKLASAHPPARAYYLLYAAALDRYMNKKDGLLSKEPVLYCVSPKKEFSEVYEVFTHYESHCGKSPAVWEWSREAKDLEDFLATGYDGKLRGEIEAYIKDLRQNAKAK